MVKTNERAQIPSNEWDAVGRPPSPRSVWVKLCPCTLYANWTSLGGVLRGLRRLGDCTSCAISTVI
jgi:hypothetical protein